MQLICYLVGSESPVCALFITTASHLSVTHGVSMVTASATLVGWEMLVMLIRLALS